MAPKALPKQQSYGSTSFHHGVSKSAIAQIEKELSDARALLHSSGAYAGFTMALDKVIVSVYTAMVPMNASCGACPRQMDPWADP